MKVGEYLSRKYGKKRPSTINYQEAQAFGVSYPLRAGWLAEVADNEISEPCAAGLLASLMAHGARLTNPGRRECFDRAIELLGELVSGPITPARAKSRKELKRERRAERRLARERNAVRKIDAARVASDAFLETYEWRVLRMKALKRDGARCCCCGATPSDGVRMHVDHIRPRRVFPDLALDLNNLQVLCEVCNHGKGNWDQTDWRDRAAVVDLEEWQRAHLRSIK